MAAKRKSAKDRAAAESAAADTVADDIHAPIEDLPDYHGRKPVGMRTSVSGTGNRVTRSHGIDERFVIVSEVECTFAGHKSVDGKIHYVETYAVRDMFEVMDPKAGHRLLAVMRQAARARRDAARGQDTMPSADGVDLGDVGYTDGSGVVLTPKELAELRGDPAAALIGDTTQVVVVYDNGERRLWPDDYPPDTIRPSVNDVDGEHGTVESVLDGVTGEPVDDYTAPDGLPADPEFDVDPPTTDDGEPAADDAGGIAEAHLPTTADFGFVDRDIPMIRDDLEDVDDPDHLQRILNAERQGRGRALKPRQGAIKVIEARIAAVAESVTMHLEDES